MPARKPITDAHQPPAAYITGASHSTKKRNQALKKPGRQYALGLFGLALAVVLCGLGHRLASYLQRESPIERISITRLWLEPRNDAVGTAYRISGKNRYLSDSQPLPCSAQRNRRIDIHSADAPVVAQCRPASFQFLIPFRSPPSLRFSLA